MTGLHLGATDVLVVAFEDVVKPSVLYPVLLPVVIRAARARHTFCAAASSVAVALLLAGLMPSLVESLWFTAIVVAVLAVLSLVYWSDLRVHRGTRGEAEAVLTLLGLVSFLLGVVVLSFGFVTGGGGSGTRPLTAAAILLVTYRWSVPWFRSGYGTRVAWIIAGAGFALLCGRGLVWWREFSSLSSMSVRQTAVFPNIARLRAVDDGLVKLREGKLGESVASLRTVLRGSDPEAMPLRVARWSGLHRQSLAMILAFGGRAPFNRENAAVSFSWDSGNQRLLVLGTDGRLVALNTAGPPLDLGTPLPNAVAVSASRDGSGIGLLTASGGILVTDQGGREAWRRSLPQETYKDLAATEVADQFLVLRKDGGVYSVTVQEARLLGGYPMWPDTNPAISIVVTPDGKGHYVLDRFGGVHPRGRTAISYDDLRGQAQTNHYWPGKDIARSIDISPLGYPVYVDQYGGLHAVLKRLGRPRYCGNDYPPLDRPIAVDLIAGVVPQMIHVLCGDGAIIPIPELGWLFPEEGG